MLIKAEAIGVNFVDTYFRSGLYPRELPFVLGAEVGGTVLLHAGAGGVGLIPHPVGNQPRRTCHHHGLHRGKGRVVPEGRCRRCAELSRQPSKFGADQYAYGRIGAAAVTTAFQCACEALTWRTGELFKAIAAGTIQVTVSRPLPPTEAAQAHRLILTVARPSVQCASRGVHLARVCSAPLHLGRP